MREGITHVAFDIRQDSITAAWLLPVGGEPCEQDAEGNGEAGDG